MDIRVFAVRRLSESVAIAVNVSRTIKKKGRTQLCGGASHGTRGIGNRQLVEQPCCEARLHLASTVGDNPQVGGVRKQIIAQVRAIPGSHQGIGHCELTGERHIRGPGGGPFPIK